jgi:hypothetical protein
MNGKSVASCPKAADPLSTIPGRSASNERPMPPVPQEVGSGFQSLLAQGCANPLIFFGRFPCDHPALGN